MDLEESPPAASVPNTSKSTDIGDLKKRAFNFSAEIDRAVGSGSLKEAQEFFKELETVAREVAAKSEIEGFSDGGAAERAMAADRLVREYETLEEKAEEALSEQTGRADTEGIQAINELLDTIREGLRRARHLSVPVPAIGAEPELLALQSSINDQLEEARRKIVSVPPALELPFSFADAGLVVAASPGLAKELLVPLLQAHWSGKVILMPSERQWFLETSGVDIDPGAIVTAETDDPYTTLLDGGCDLVVTDRPADAEVRMRFSKAFSGKSIDSRAYSEVIALDAVALLGNPDSSIERISTDQIGSARWSVRPADASRIRRMIGPVTKFVAVENPFLALLDDSSALSLAFFHQCRPNLRAKYLAYQPDPAVRSLAPSSFSIGTEDYGLTYRVLAVHSPRSRLSARQFVDFVTSDVGQGRVAEAGFVDLRLRHSEEMVDPKVLATLGEALGMSSINSAHRYSTNLRFGFNESALDIKAQADIGRIARALAGDFPKGKVVILGFTDNAGSSNYNHGLSVKRAKYIVEKLEPFKIPAVAAGLGEQLPIDTNDTEQGRARNRRAEVWVVEP